MANDTCTGDGPAETGYEIEITPEMIEAGIDAIKLWSVGGDIGSSNYAEIAVTVFLAMSIGLERHIDVFNDVDYFNNKISDILDKARAVV